MFYNTNQLTPEDIQNVQNQLAANEHWQKVPANHQAELLDSLWKDYGDQIFEETIQKVKPKEKKTRARKQKVDKKVQVKPVVEKKEDKKE